MYTLYIEDIHGGQTHEHPFGEGELIVGRSREKCDIVLPADNISRRHAKIYTADDRCFIQDLNSSNGVFVDGVRIRDIREMEPSTRVRIGDYILYVEGEATAPAAPSEYGRLVGGLAGGPPFVPLRDTVSLVGRGKDTALTIIDASVSRVHAKLTVTQAGEIVLQDLKSSNGTFVNDQRIEQTVIRHGDRVRFGNVEYQLEPAGGAAPSAPAHAPAQAQAQARGSAPAPANPWPEMQPVSAPSQAGPAYGADDDFGAHQRSRRARFLLIGLGAAVVAVVVAIVLVLSGKKEAPAPAPEEVAKPAEVDEKAEREKRRQQRLEEQIEEDLEEARKLLTARDWAAAKATLERAAELDEGRKEVKEGLALVEHEAPNAKVFAEAEAARAKRQFGAALAAYGKVAAESVYRKDADVAIQAIRGMRVKLLEEGEAAEKAREWQNAHDRFDEALQIEPGDAVLERRLAKLKRRLQ